MEELKINYETKQPTVSARDLHDGLEVLTPFHKWMPRMCEYGFTENEDYEVTDKNVHNSNGGKQTIIDYDISINMAKEICMIQRSDKGKQYRKYFLDLEKAWNTPEQIMARALKMADKEIDSLKSQNIILIEDIQRMKPMEIFANAVSVSDDSILIGGLSKLLKQNDVNIGQNRLFEWLRNHGYLIKRKGNDYNMPTQKSMELGLFEIKERTFINPNGIIKLRRTPMVTGKGQIYFINKFHKLISMEMITA